MEHIVLAIWHVLAKNQWIMVENIPQFWAVKRLFGVDDEAARYFYYHFILVYIIQS